MGRRRCFQLLNRISGHAGLIHLVLEQVLGGDKEDKVDVADGQGTEKMHINSVILAAHSDYFMSLFSNGMSESSSGVAKVKVSEEGVVFKPKISSLSIQLKAF